MILKSQKFDYIISFKDLNPYKTELPPWARCLLTSWCAWRITNSAKSEWIDSDFPLLKFPRFPLKIPLFSPIWPLTLCGKEASMCLKGGQMGARERRPARLCSRHPTPCGRDNDQMICSQRYGGAQRCDGRRFKNQHENRYARI